jgi:predicted TIM-barrel fold metal-dependent hydrolase
MIVDGFARANSKIVTPQQVKEHMLVNNIDQLVMIPDYELFNKGKPLPVDGFRSPQKDMLLPFLKKIGRSIKRKKVSEKIVKSNQFLHHLHLSLPNEVLPFVAADINLTGCATQLKETYKDWQFKGLHIPNHLLKADLITPQMYDFFYWVEEMGLPVIINLNGECDLYAVQKVIRDFKKVNFIIQHMVGIEKLNPCMGLLKNFWFDLSPMYAISDYRLQKAIDVAGADRLLYGTGFPYHKDNIVADVARLRQLGLNEKAVNGITGKNWHKILKTTKEKALVS